MDFLVIGLDRPDGGRRRQELRLAHLEYVADKQDRLKYGGPLLDGDGRATGSVLILSFQDRAALDAHLGGDPYFRDGLFEAVFIRETRQVVPEAAPGQLAAEIARQKATGSGVAG
ncbi:MAG TPA: YciI family protein [Thalassobaculum sp.]